MMSKESEFKRCMRDNGRVYARFNEYRELTMIDMVWRRSSQTCTTASRACFVASSGVIGGTVSVLSIWDNR